MVHKLKTFLDDNTYLSAGMIIMLLGGAVSSGMMIQEQRQVSKRLDVLEIKVDEVAKIVIRLESRDVAERENLRLNRHN